MNDLDELRRRLVDASPDFPAVSPGVIRGRVRRRRLTGLAAVVAVGLLAGAAVVVPRLVLDPPAAPVAVAPVPTPRPTLPPRACPTRSPNDANEIVDYADAVHLGGRDYLDNGEASGRPVRQAEVGVVRCSISRIRPGSGYLLQDGDATLLPAGAKLYSVRGLTSWFRLLSADGRIFDSQPAATARRGGDVLPLTGQVTSIELIGVGGGVRRLTDPAAVTAAVAGIVAAPADPGGPWPYADAGQLRFRLRDGSTLVRQWNPARRLISGNIQLPASAVALLTAAR